MMTMCSSIMEQWGEGTVILSPKNVAEARIANHSRDLASAGATTLFDPQLFFPGYKHKNLREYSYWPDDYDPATFWSSDNAETLLGRLLELNTELGTGAVILPGPYCEAIDDTWLQSQESLISTARELSGDDQPLYATVALSSEALRNTPQLHEFLDDAAQWPVDGVYLLFQHRDGSYLVNDTIWLGSALDVAASFRLRSRRVIWGYCNQQQLIGACAAVDEIGVGTWMNGRMFKPEDFRGPSEREGGNRSAWFYSPSVLSEYQLDRLDLAKRLGVLDSLQLPAAFDSPYGELPFAGGEPSNSGFGESEGFVHFLSCLRTHASQAVRRTFEETVRFHEEALNEAERLLTVLHSKGIRSGQRDFANAIDANRGALASLQASRGPLLARAWKRLTA
jgi:hypothetical protein